MAENDLLYIGSTLSRTAELSASRLLYQAPSSGSPEEPTENDPPEGDNDIPTGAQEGEAWRTLTTEQVTAAEWSPYSGYHETEILIPGQSTPNPPNPEVIVDAHRIATFEAIGSATGPIDRWEVTGVYINWEAPSPNINMRYTVRSAYRMAEIRKVTKLGGYTTYSAFATSLGITTAQLFERMRSLKFTGLTSTLSRGVRYSNYFDFPNKNCLPEGMAGWAVNMGSNRVRLAAQTSSSGIRWISNPVIDTSNDNIAANNMYTFCELSPFYYSPDSSNWASTNSRTIEGITYRIPADPDVTWNVSFSTYLYLWC